MSLYQRYGAYRNSSAEWLGSVPAHWSDWKLKHLFKEKKAVKGGSLPAGAISFGEVVSKEMLNEETLATYQEVLPGEFLVNPINLNYDLKSLRVAHSNIAVRVSPAYIVLRDLGVATPRFLRWAMYLFDVSHMKTLGAGVRQTITFNEIGNTYLVLPGSGEQESIATLLDRETARIDALIEKKTRFIELLKEKRQALITQAVTKGLDPTVPMKDSGVEWIGEVPAHWEVLPIKCVCSLLKDGTHLPPPRVDGGIPLLSVRNIQEEKFAYRDDDSTISEDDYKVLCRSFFPKAQDVLLAIVGATIGKTAIVPDNFGNFHIQRSLGVFRTNARMSHLLLHRLFQTSTFQQLLWENTGFSAQPGIYLGALANFKIPVPPVADQWAIVDRVEKTTSRIERLLAKANSSISLLKERRSALITAAVTGQIDLREEA